ncbi:FAD-dependent oxidoreductase [Actinocatenispora rupis]|uniref:FAD-dependent oxidoreductase n=1 Tax=Actinocatenispora rupis TaxID=519421 RepID=A0A8J3IYP2_9ACTN|nr:FAD-dependent oxidoreductase [Actinocatenispora rupis]GID12476.1 FAD-dependent oxidoreductase [Actinocatenispora rupis]
MTADPEVLVVGGGLCGLSTALFLAHHGVRVLLVERHPALLSHPRQRSVNVRVMELYRQVGLADAIRAARADFVTAGEYVVVRARTLAEEYRPVGHQGDVAAAEDASPCRGTPIDQDRVEALVCARARELGARIEFGTALVELAEDPDGVTALLSTGATTRRVRARYLVAADGADGGIRATIGIPRATYGPAFDLLTLLVHADLRPALAGRTVHMAHLDLPRPRTYLMALDRDGTRWVFGTADDPTRGEPDDRACAELVRAAAGLPDAPVRLLPQIAGTDRRLLRFRVGAALAEKYRAGRVFLVGDAAHLMPPTGGFGGATGVAEAHNLAWKLAWVLRGRAGGDLLDSYHDERHPVALFTLRQALVRAADRFDTGTPGELVDRSTVLLGPRYDSAAVRGGGPDPVPVGDLSGAPGSRAPHVPLPGDRSTLDLYGTRFVLLAGAGADGWARAGRRHGVSTYRFGPDLPDAAARHGIGPLGALLVRPDGYVAWRSPGPSADPDGTLAAVLATILAVPERAGSAR